MKLNMGLVLEGGGMRGVYTAGVLESFLDYNIEFPYVIGVSAGACNAASYLSKQKGRNRKVNIDFIKDPKYLSWKNYFRQRELFGMDYIFDEIPNKIVPYDFEAFHNNNTEFVIGATDCFSGKPIYLAREDYKSDVLTAIRASSSLPFVAPIVQHQHFHLLDGGISDPIPIRKAQQDGLHKNVVILTRNRDYEKKPSKFHFLVKRKYPQYNGLHSAMINRWRNYNETTRYLAQLESEGKVFLICPKEPLKVGRVEKNPDRLTELYEQGYRDGESMIDNLIKWNEKINE
jgi:predicted patatin/cPLA2 family phospholipase